jgi:hypothetical protein
MAQKQVQLSDSSSSDTSDEAGWVDVESDSEEKLTIVSLFDGATFPDAESMMAYCKEKFDFDFTKTCRRLALDFHGAVRLINFGKGCP